MPVDSAAYNHPVIVDVFGDLNADALRAALATVTARHEALRTIIDVAGDRACPRVLAVVVPTIEWADVTDIARMDGLDGPGMTYSIRSRVDRPFDLSSEWPPRMTAFRLDDGYHRILLVLQRVAEPPPAAGPPSIAGSRSGAGSRPDTADGSSDAALLADLADAYAALAAPGDAVSWSTRGVAR